MAAFSFCIADGDGGLQIISAENPDNPVIFGAFDTPNAMDIVLTANIAYIADGVSGVKVFDIFNKAHPTLIWSYDTSGEGLGVGIYDGYYDGNDDYVYVTDGMSIEIIKFVHDFTPILTDSLEINDQTHDLDINGDYIYIANGNDGIQIVDITNPYSPETVQTYDDVDNASDITIRGDYGYIACETELNIMDVSNPEFPFHTGSCETYSSYKIAVRGDYTYIADKCQGLVIIDISVPLNPGYIKKLTTPLKAIDVAVDGDYVYVAYSDHVIDAAGFSIVDCSDPVHPFVRGSFSSDHGIWGIDVHGQYVYISNDEGGLHIIDIINPALPVSIGSWSWPFYCSGSIAIHGTYAYVYFFRADLTPGSDFLSIINVLNPTMPYPVYFFYNIPFHYGDNPGGIIANNEYVYITGGSFFSIIDPGFN